MAITTTSTLQTNLTWIQSDTGDGENSTRDTVTISEDITLANGTGEGEVDTVWLGSASLGAGVTDTIDLNNLDRLIFGGTLNVSFASGDIKGIFVENTSTGNDQYIFVANTGLNNFTHYSNDLGCSIQVYPKNIFYVSNQYAGYTVNSSNRYIEIVDGGNGSSYKIGIIGVD